MADGGEELGPGCVGPNGSNHVFNDLSPNLERERSGIGRLLYEKSSIEALYGCRCHTLVCLYSIGEKELIGAQLVDQMIDMI